MTRRTNWWTYFDGRFGDLAQDDALRRILDEMRRYRRHRKLELDFERLERDFRGGERSYCRLFDLMESQHAERLGMPRWGDKSLHTERYADRVFECFPDARIIHMVRDPRDRYASVLKRWRSKRGGVGSATAAWLASVDLGQTQRRAILGPLSDPALRGPGTRPGEPVAFRLRIHRSPVRAEDAWDVWRRGLPRCRREQLVRALFGRRDLAPFDRTVPRGPEPRARSPSCNVPPAPGCRTSATTARLPA